MTTSLFVGKDTNKRAKIQIIFEIFQAEVFSALVKYTKYSCKAKQNAQKYFPWVVMVWATFT